MSIPIAVITGGGRGIGRSICERFGSAGFHVVALSRSLTELAQTKQIVESKNGRCDVHSLDFTEKATLTERLAEIMLNYDCVDVLVNNAGIAPLARVEELEPALFHSLMDVNMAAVYHMCRTAWPLMRRARSATIVNISSVASIDAFSGFAAYGASKAWVNAWTKGLAEEGRLVGIRVFAVAPGG